MVTPRWALLALALGLGACGAVLFSAAPRNSPDTTCPALTAHADCSGSLDLDNDDDHHCGRAMAIAIDLAQTDVPRAFNLLIARANRLVDKFLFISRAPPVFAPSV
jgi:hypothetical protein